MALYSKVLRRTWVDERFRRLSAAEPNAQTLWLRLLTGPECGSIPGCIAANDAGLARALGWKLKPFQERFAELSREGLAEADWEAGFVWLPKAIRHNLPANPNVVKGWGKRWDELPECALKAQALRNLKRFVEPLGEGFAKAFGQSFPEPFPNGMANQDQDQEQDQDQDPEGAGRVAPEPPKPPETPAPAEPSPKPRKKSTRGTRLPDGWAPPDSLYAWARSNAKVRMTRATVDEQLEGFRDYWAGVAGAKGRKVDWVATLRTWLRRNRADDKHGRIPVAPPPPPEVLPEREPDIATLAFGPRELSPAEQAERERRVAELRKAHGDNPPPFDPQAMFGDFGR
jgi:hypothetical protein